MAPIRASRLLPAMTLRRLAFMVTILGNGVANAEAVPRAPHSTLPIPNGATELNLVTAPALSPDGATMVFECLGDIWTAPTTGGEALRVVDDPARDAYPLFSPDGLRIVFTSERSGSPQIYSVPAAGGEVARHTWNTEGCELECLSPDGKSAIVRGFRERPGFRSAGLLVVSLTADQREQRLFDAPADAASWSPDGKSVLFTTRGEQLYRKGYRGSRASRIWRFTIASGKFEPLVAEPTESRFPIWQADAKSFTYLSARTGTLNLWKYELATGKSSPLTGFTGDGVFTRDPSADGTVFVFHRGFGLYRLKVGEPVVPLNLWTREKLKPVARVRQKIRGTAAADFTPDLRHIVFAAAGDLWLRRTENEAPLRLTETAAVESGPRFSPDGKWLYFLRDDGRDANYFRANLENDSLANESPVTTGERSKSRFKPSPDGSRLAWMEGAGDVFVCDADGKNPRRVFESWDLPTIDWSPDGRWLAVAAEDRNANRDIWLAAADASRPPLDLTRHPAFEGSPRWSPDGRWLVFSARRESDGISRLWKIDLAGLAATTSDAQIRRLADAAKVLPTGGAEPSRVVWAADSKTLFFQSKSNSDGGLRSIAIAGGAVKNVAKLRGIPIRVTPGGSLLWRVGGTPAIFVDGKNRAFPIAFSAVRVRGELTLVAFRRVWRTLGERFYDPTMNGTDWPAMLAKYEPAVAHVRGSRQFDRLVSQLFGELNASHLSFLRKPWSGEKIKIVPEPPTAHPGLIFRNGGPRGPLVIRRVLAGSPAATAHLKPGETILKIAGQTVDNRTPLHLFLAGAAGKPLEMTIRAKSGAERTVSFAPISYATARGLGRRRQLATARLRTQKAGNFAYIAVPDMSLPTISAVQLEIYRASLTADGLILDLRDNGGGREADRLLSSFTQPAHSFTVPRGGPAGYPNARLVNPAWRRPFVVLCNQNTFSNAEIFCHAVKQTKRGPLVGTATAGGVISAVKTTIPDAGELQVPFRGWFGIDTGKNLDLNGAQPDFPVDLTPADEDANRDPQLENALALLKTAVANFPPLPEPKLRK